MSQGEVSEKAYLGTFAALLGLLVLTVGAAFTDLGALNIVVALGIASAKAALILLYFMHLKPAGNLLRLAAGTGMAWLAILIVFVLVDYASRRP